MFDFLQRFFGKPPSSTTAKERLRLVLLSDHLSLAPDVVEALKTDLVEVISRYCEVDVANCDVTFEQQDKQIAMLANIPILGLRSRPIPPAPPPSAPPPPAREPDPVPVPSLDLGGASASVVEEPVEAAPPAPPVTAPRSTEPRPTRRKRRKNLTPSSTAPAT